MISVPNLTRSRSPVMSIRTQPEDEDALRAEIAAAKRTQHEILPRESLWQSTFAKRDSEHRLRRTYRPVQQRYSSPSQPAIPYSAHDYMQYHEPFVVPVDPRNQAQSHMQRASSSKNMWRRFTGRKVGHPDVEVGKSRAVGSSDNQGGTRRWKRKKTISGRHADSTTTKDEEVQRAQWRSRVEESAEEQNTVADLCQPLSAKTKRTLRKSVYGSLSSTKSFLKNTSKNQPENQCSSPVNHTTPAAPHMDDFGSKDQLRNYINNTSVASPLSPVDESSKTMSASPDVGPVELSAGPVPAELEGNAPNGTDHAQSAVSRTSTPSIRDLPPYIDDKKFSTDIAKEHSHHNYGSDSPYTCNSCQKDINCNDIYDFCSICDSGGRVLCVDCADRGPCCRHELEELLRSHSVISRSTMPVRRLENPDIVQRSKHGDSRLSGPETNGKPDYDPWPDNKMRSRGSWASANALPPNQTRPVYSFDAHDKLLNQMKDVQLDFLKEMTDLRREQELVYRDRELSLRAREIEARAQQITLQEREAIIQHKSEQVLRNLKTFASYTELTKDAFIGAQFAHSPVTQDEVNNQCVSEPAVSLDSNDCNHAYKTNAAKVVAEVEASIDGWENDERHTKSCMAQKRKKATVNGSTGSTPAAISTPERSGKVLSRDNSERDASQDEEEDNDRRRTPKKHKQESPTSSGPQLLFACPYSKQDPIRYSSRNLAEKNYRGCVGHFLTDISRLKQHLRRVHWQPETFCPRCYKEFDNSTKLSEHAGAPTACLARECPFPEKMNKTQQEKIHVKKPRVPPETVWYDIYKILFPGSPLPKSPYVERDDVVATPSSAGPSCAINVQATRQLSNCFNQRLDQYDELQDPRLRLLIDQALSESFHDLLNSFSLSTASSCSPGAGPSILVPPESRSPPDTAQVIDSPHIVRLERPNSERSRRPLDTFGSTQQVPRPQQSQLPRLNTALQVPSGHYRSPSSQSRTDSLRNESPADVVFDMNILPHIQEDQGYDDECRSFEQGDDQQAMAFVVGPTLPSSRNKSVMSIDSGYGSGRSYQNPNLPPSHATPNILTMTNAQVQNPVGHQTKVWNDMGKLVHPELNRSYQPSDHSHVDQGESSISGFSYSNFLDPVSQEDILNGMYYLSDPNNPWCYP